jgi:hypothetical protein
MYHHCKEQALSQSDNHPYHPCRRYAVPGSWYPAIGSPIVVVVEKEIVSWPDLLNKGSLSRCRTPGLDLTKSNRRC